MQRYRKFIVAAVGAAVSGIVAALTDDVLTASEAGQTIVAVLIALGVYVAPNTPSRP